MEKYILSLDQGTTSSRAILFNKKGEICAVSQAEFRQIFPQPGWVEHDPEEILSTQIEAAKDVIRKSKVDIKEIASIGIANQRETTILWEKKTGKPAYNAIVWQCRRTAGLCMELKEQGLMSELQSKTGLVIDPYFAGTKVMWLFKNIPGLLKKAENGEICFGTVDSWLLFNLTGRHATDPSNASRTLFMNIHTGNWDGEILKMLKVPAAILPEILPSSGKFGVTKKDYFGEEIPVCSVIGDQQAALFGQGCFKRGNAKNTYGTGCFALLHTGNTPVISKNNLLTTIAWDRGNGIEYALEGSVFIAGAVIQWLRDNLKIITSALESGRIAQTVQDTGGVYLVPAFTGMGAPYWDPEVRGTIFGLTRGSSRAHIVRAALESIAYQVKDLFTSMEKDVGNPIEVLRVDGGASKNDFLMQFQADLLDISIERPLVFETTALGAAYLAGLTSGLWENIEEISVNWKSDRCFSPIMKENERTEKLKKWHKAVKTARMYV